MVSSSGRLCVVGCVRYEKRWVNGNFLFSIRLPPSEAFNCTRNNDHIYRRHWRVWNWWAGVWNSHFPNHWMTNFDTLKVLWDHCAFDNELWDMCNQLVPFVFLSSIIRSQCYKYCLHPNKGPCSLCYKMWCVGPATTSTEWENYYVWKSSSLKTEFCFFRFCSNYRLCLYRSLTV